MINQNPEQKSRDKIDALLEASGWFVQNFKKLDWNQGLGIAVREYQTDTGYADYILFIDRIPVGVVEAKKEEEGYHLTIVEEQSKGYAESKLKHINNTALSFHYESTGLV